MSRLLVGGGSIVASAARRWDGEAANFPERHHDIPGNNQLFGKRLRYRSLPAAAGSLLLGPSAKIREIRGSVKSLNH